MVLISLKSQYVSLIITLLSFFSELSILLAFLESNNYRQCRRLTRGKTVNVRHHRRYGQIPAVIAGFIFLALEILASFFCDPARIEKFQSHSCIALETSIAVVEDQDRFVQGDVIEDSCQILEEGTTYQQLGNFSLKDQQVRCSKNPVYKFERPEDINEPLPSEDTVFGCVPSTDDPSEEVCAFVFQRNNSIYFSEPLKRSTVERIKEGNGNETVSFLRTEILFAGAATLSFFATRAADALERSVTDPYELRRRVFLGAKETTCPFVDEIKEGTTAPLSLIYVLAAIWILSVFLFVTSIALFRRRIFFNFTDPLDWALYTRQQSENPAERNPVLSFDCESENQVLFVSELSIRTTESDMRDVPKREGDLELEEDWTSFDS